MRSLVIIAGLVMSGLGWAGELPPIRTVFVILMENKNWASVYGSPSAPFINQVLLPRSSWCSQYYNPPGLHPSEPNYLWLEAGTNLGVWDDADPGVNHQSTTNHLSRLLQNAGISWRSYQEDISGANVPLTVTNGYTPRHNPFVYFDDMTGTNSPTDPCGIAHNRPFGELISDLTNNTVARYNFITPNLCNDMHDSCAPLYDPILQGDNWLASVVPTILASKAYQNDGVLFITWDEGLGRDGPIGMLALSLRARGGGYSNALSYSHSSLLRTLQEIFGVTPFLGDAVNALDLSDLFIRPGFCDIHYTIGEGVRLTVTGTVAGRTNFVQASHDLVNWTTFCTNCGDVSPFQVMDVDVGTYSSRFYRVREVPPIY